MQLKIEMTDTFGGEANYCWVKRASVQIKDFASTRSVVRAVKRELGMTGRHETENYGDRLVIRPRGACVVIFVDFTA